MNCAETSIVAFHSLSVAKYLQPREKEVLAVFGRTPGKAYTRKQIAYLTGLELSCVCGRVRSLLDKKALVVAGRTLDTISNKSQELLSLPVLTQGSLF